MTTWENKIKAIRFESPDSIPMTFHINPACWNYYPGEWLMEQMERHTLLFPDYDRNQSFTPVLAPNARKDNPYLDDWGCLWKTTEDGITGTVTEHPLANWAEFDDFKAPDPEICTGVGPMDWTAYGENAEKTDLTGVNLQGGLTHGHTFLRLCDIRGYENLLYDMVDDHPLLPELIAMVESFNMRIIEKYLSLGAGFITYPEDLGMEIGPMISPDLFRKYIKPVYQRLMRPAREAGAIIHMHSDGDIRTLADDLIDGGVESLNLQDLVNGIDWIKERYAGKICIDLDIDRCRITPYGTPAEIDALIKEEVEKLGSPRGGLMMIYGLYPGVPRENVIALMDAMERYASFHRH